MITVKVNREKCIGCLQCVSACMIAHEEPDGRQRIVLDNKGKLNPIFCRHCAKPRCAEACPTGAMSKNVATGSVDYDREQCISCFQCIEACPFDVLRADTPTETYIMKCDLCRDSKQGKPQCMRRCPMHVITYEIS